MFQVLARGQPRVSFWVLELNLSARKGDPPPFNPHASAFGQHLLHPSDIVGCSCPGLSCLWADLAETLVDGQVRSWLPGGTLITHQVVLLEGKECYFKSTDYA